MRVEKAGISVRAIPATHSVLFGFDATEEARRGLLGFALGVRNAQGAVVWMRGFKFFRETAPNPQPGERRSTREHPVQDFQWGDYNCQPGQAKDYVVQALYGTPTDIRPGPEIDLRVATADPRGDHLVFHNRGAIPSQAFADRFGNVGPTEAEQSDPANEKVRWLSRGLLEAALAFIAEATGPAHELRVAAYEFTYAPIAQALREAAGRGVTVRLVHDGGDRRRDDTIAPTHTSGPNAALIAATGLDAAATVSLHPRTRYAAITHNKFIVRLENGHPVAVWTGSTNFTPSGFLGQSNLAHLIRDEALARAFSSYWELLAQDLPTRAMKAAVAALTPDPLEPLPRDVMVPLFSPRPAGALQAYARALTAATHGAMFTAAFGVARPLAEAFAAPGDHPRLILSERAEKNPEVQAILAGQRKLYVALGTRLASESIALKIGGHALDQWFRGEEHFRSKGNIFYIHTKLMLLDPMGEAPQIFVGSANFSAPSVEGNDENMVLMRGPAFARIAAIHAAEFMRLFNHLYFRTVAIRTARAGRGDPARAAILDPDDRWVARHFKPGALNTLLREMFR